jgi:PAS domain S-box-containing protein
MKKYQHMTKAQLINGMKMLERGVPAVSLALERKRLLHELNVRQCELREAQLLLEAARTRYTGLYDFAPVGFVTFDAKGIIREINLVAAGMLGVERTRLVGVPFHRHIARGDRARFHEHLGKLKKPEDRVVTELHLARKGNAPIELLSVLTYDAKKKSCLYLVALADLTTRKQAEMAREALLLLGTQLNAVSNPVQASRAILDTADKLWKWDSATLNLYWPETDQMQVVLNCDVVDGQRREVPPVRPLGPPSPRMRRILRGGPELILRKPPFTKTADSVMFGDTSRRSASLMYVPLRQHGQPVGVVSLQSYTPQAYTSGDLKRLQALADHCGSALERIRSDVSLRESEARFRQLGEATFEGLAVSVAGELVDGNSQLAAMLGYEQSEMVGRSVLDFVAPESRALVAERVHTGYETPYETLNLRKDGSVFPAESHARHMIWNGKPARVTAIRDLTERKRAETALRQSEEKFQKVFQAAPVLMSLSELADGRYVAVNEHFCALSGFSQEEAQGRTSVELGWISAADRERLIAEMETKGRVREMELNSRSKDGRQLVCRYACEYLLVGGRNLLLSIATDITSRKETEEALRKAKQHLEAHIANSPLAIVEFDPDNRVVRWSGTAEQTFGWSEGEILGKAIQEIRWVHEEDAESVWQVAADMLAGRCSHDHHINRNYRKDGTVIHCEWYNSALHDRQGRLTSIFSLVLDITGRKQAEAALRESEDRFRTLFEASPIAVALHSDDGRIIETNHSYQRLLGYTGAELKKLGVKRITYPADQAVGNQLYHELVKGTRNHYQREKRYCRKDGQVIWGVSTVSAIRSPEGRLRYMISAVEDITERRRAQEALREREEIYSTIVDQAWDAIALVEVPSGRMVEFNATAYQNLGYTREEFAALRLSDVDSALRPETSQAFLARTFASGGGVFETRVRHKKGELREVRVSSRPVKIRGCDYLAMICSDVSERKRLEREIQRVGAEERRRISHELHDGLGQTLTGIAFKAKALQGTLAQSVPPLANDLGEIAKLINGAIAETRRLAQGLEPIQIENAGLVAALAGLAAETRHLFGLECVFRCAEPDLSVATAIAAALYRITQEAIHNAISHGLPRTIEIELGRVVEQLRLCVKDDGKGFAPSETGDAGMGLRIMRHRTQVIGGTLNILSQPGQGTRIECFLPLELLSVKLEKPR